MVLGFSGKKRALLKSGFGGQLVSYSLLPGPRGHLALKGSSSAWSTGKARLEAGGQEKAVQTGTPGCPLCLQ